MNQIYENSFHLTTEKILSLADDYARETTISLSKVKGFPLSEDQISGFLHIYKAYEKAADNIYRSEGHHIDTQTFLDSVYEDFISFIDTDIPLNKKICSDLIQEHTANRLTSIYIIKNNINKSSEMENAHDLVRKLLRENRWAELNNMTRIDDKWLQEI